MFDEIQSETFAEREERILAIWNERQLFEQSVKARESQPHFVFYDGPPFATGLPHYGHILAGTIKDVVLRYKTMKGFYAPRRFGWDCHGLPIENEVERAFNLTGADSISQFGVAAFNEECRKIVLRYTSEWKTVVNRMGRWVDFNNTYRTMDKPFMESVWWVFKQLYDKGLVYEGFKVMPYSAKLGTPLSNFEAGENYKDVDDPSLTVAFSLANDPDTHLLIWTTTPWTLVSNLAIMVGPDIAYVKVRDHASTKTYILAESRLGSYYKDPAEYTIMQTYTGKDLEGMHYEPLLPYFADRKSENAFRVILEDSISTEDGTGLVHCAPAFGEVDFYACLKAGINLVCPVDSNGRFTAEIPEYTGQFVKDADKDIIKRLKAQHRVIHQATIHHRYPFCWRSDTPLIYKAVSTWFVAVERIKKDLIDANNQIHWTPSHIKDGRFGKWLEGARDWAISRNRYWGTPIPIWRAEDGELLVLGSIQELEEATHTKIDDIHRHFIDHLTIEKNGKTFTRIPEVFDCWFESGSMPYAQNHYPFENRTLFENNFPADFIGEGLDQTRGWFYTLTILSAALFEKPAFKNVIVNGIVLASDGNKMSKRLRNYPDPMEMVHKYGADAIRLYMMNSPAVYGENLCFTEAGVEIVLRQVILPLWNAYSFFITYARIYSWKPSPTPNLKPDAVIDQWILSLLNKLIHEVELGMDDYNLNTAVEPFVSFIDQLTNWYIRRSRRRFWEDQDSPDRQQAFSTLYHTLITLCKIAAPYIPFLSDAIYQNLKTPQMPPSVHLCDFPEYHPETRNTHLEDAMTAVQATVSLGHALRKEHKLKVRQPLASAFIASTNPQTVEFLTEQQHLIADELNVKSITISSDDSNYVNLHAKPNFRTLGKKVGKLMKPVQDAITNLPKNQLNSLLNNQPITLTIDNTTLTITADDVQIERSTLENSVASTQNNITVALNTQLTQPLILEGLARELVNKINTMRRDANLNVTDRINIQIDSTSDVEQAYQLYKDYINNEVLASSFSFYPNNGTAWELNNHNATILITKV